MKPTHSNDSIDLSRFQSHTPSSGREAVLPNTSSSSSSSSTASGQTLVSPPQFGPVSLADPDILASGAAVPPGPLGPHTPPILTAHTAVSTEVRDHRLDVFESEVFKKNTARLGLKDPAAQKYMVDLYNDSQDIQQSGKPAEHWVHKAVAQGHAGAQRFLGLLYFFGLGVEQSDAEAFTWVRLAAEQGDAGAQGDLGNLYLKGWGVPKNDDSAAEWIKKAADQGDAVAQTQLGNLYFNGSGVPKNNESAFKWIQKAADQGDAVAQTQLGVLYHNGRGVPRNADSAVKWFQKAADKGESKAQMDLGWMYFNGRGVAKDDKQAAYWMMKSALSDHGLSLPYPKTFPKDLCAVLPELFTKSSEFHCLKTLDLRANKIDDEAVAHLARLIAENQTLEVIDLRGNPIGEKGAAALALALRTNQTLKELHLDLTDSTQPARAEITRALNSNKNIAVLTQEVIVQPARFSDELPLEVITLLEQATIPADQKAADTERTLEQTRDLLNELRLSVAEKFISGHS